MAAHRSVRSLKNRTVPVVPLGIAPQSAGLLVGVGALDCVATAAGLAGDSVGAAAGEQADAATSKSDATALAFTQSTVTSSRVDYLTPRRAWSHDETDIGPFFAPSAQ
jgi:hypothetical protein